MMRFASLFLACCLAFLATTAHATWAVNGVAATSGGEAVVRRYPTDASDVLVYRLDEEAGATTVANTGSTGSADLTVVGSPTLGRNGLFTTSMSTPGTGRDLVSGAAAVEPAYPVTVSLWVYLTAFPGGGSYASLVQKAFYTTGTCGVPFQSLAIYLNNTGDGQWLTTVSVGGAATVVTNSAPKIQLNTWTHLGFSYDGANIRSYLQGELVSTQAQTGAIDYSSHGLWAISNDPNTTCASVPVTGKVDEVRVASVARDAAWFLAVAKAGINLAD